MKKLVAASLLALLVMSLYACGMKIYREKSEVMKPVESSATSQELLEFETIIEECEPPVMDEKIILN